MAQYFREIPRDLFNEANLLKCLGALYIETENYQHIEISYDHKAFNIAQDPADGSLFCVNVKLLVNGQEIKLFRPLNSRDPYPLFFYDEDDEIAEEVFTDKGKLSSAFRRKFV